MYILIILVPTKFELADLLWLAWKTRSSDLNMGDVGQPDENTLALAHVLFLYIWRLTSLLSPITHSECVIKYSADKYTDTEDTVTPFQLP